MLKVVLVEDECLVREGLRDSIPWKDLGYEFAGEAADGELALSLIRKVKPDLVITDIKMPFMDGLDLCRLVTAELPKTKIIIISGYDDFEYARKAIELGVEQYLLKPITKAQMTESLQSIKDKLDKELEQRQYLERFASESQEYEQYSRRKFFEQLVYGSLPVNEIYGKAAELGMPIDAAWYNVVVFMIQPEVIAGEYSEFVSGFTSDLLAKLAANPAYLMFRWNLMSYAVLIKSDKGDIEALTKECIDTIELNCVPAGDQLSWYAAAGWPVERLSRLPECFQTANRRLSYRHLAPKDHILTEESVKSGSNDDMTSINSLDVGMVDPMLIRSFLQTGLAEEIDEFVNTYMDNIGAAIKSLMFRQYVLLSLRFNSAIAIGEFGHDKDAYLESLPQILPEMNVDQCREYISEVLRTAIALRDKVSKNRYNSTLQRALEYIKNNFTDADISLNTVAREVNISANYFSAVFSQEMDETFIEYLTEMRLEHAKKLLRTSDLRSGEIALEVGYRDPRYFSFLFKKVVGCTPRDYRSGLVVKK